jgi:hypothetical protein
MLNGYLFHNTSQPIDFTKLTSPNIQLDNKNDYHYHVCAEFFKYIRDSECTKHITEQ